MTPAATSEPATRTAPAPEVGVEEVVATLVPEAEGVSEAPEAVGAVELPEATAVAPDEPVAAAPEPAPTEAVELRHESLEPFWTVRTEAHCWAPVPSVTASELEC